MTLRSVAATVLAIVVSGAVGEPAAAAAPPTLSLAAAQKLALANHPDIRTVAFDVAAAKEAIGIARSAYAPQVVGSGVSTVAPPGTRIAANVAGITDPTVLQRTSGGIAVSQYITDFGHTADLVQSSELAAQAEAARGQETKLTVLLDVTQAYLEALRAQALLRVAVQTLSERDTLLRQVTVLQRAGLRSTLDVSIAQRDASVASQMIVEARAQRRDAMANLTETLGSSDETEFSLVGIGALPSIPRVVGPLIDEMLANNPEITAMGADAAAARKRAAAIARETSPTVTAYGYFGGTPIRSANEAINQAYETAGISINVPIENGGELAAARQQALDQADAADTTLQSEKNVLLRDTRVAFDDVQAARGNIDATNRVLQTAQTAFRLTQARYRIGLNSIVDLSEAQLQVTRAEIDHTNATYDYIEQGAGLDFVTGVLTPDI